MEKNVVNTFIECLLPITACNIKCHYCYVAQRDNRKMRQARLKYPPDIIAKALRKDRVGGTAYISICGAGETMMQKELPDIVNLLLQEGHFVNITTNGTIDIAFKTIVEKLPPPMRGKLNFSFSLHYIELKRRGWIEKFFDNFNYARQAGSSVVLQMNLCDEYVDYFDEIKSICLERAGALPQLAATRDEQNLDSDIRLFTKHSKEEYNNFGEEFDSPLFRFTMRNFMVSRKEFCYAGKWTYVLDLSTGILKPCYASQIRQNIFEDIDRPIKFQPVGNHCHSPFCMNSSHFLALGNIPSLLSPSYADLRNRHCTDGREWYTEEFKEAMSGKLYENNDADFDRYAYQRQAIEDGLLHYGATILSPKMRQKIKSIFHVP